MQRSATDLGDHWEFKPATTHKKMKFSIKNFFSKFDQIRSKKPLTENFIIAQLAVKLTLHGRSKVYQYRSFIAK